MGYPDNAIIFQSFALQETFAARADRSICDRRRAALVQSG
jgi:hypothetical protein